MLFSETVSVYSENNTEHTNPVNTSQETHHGSATEPNRSMIFRERVALYCGNHTEHTNTLCGKNAVHCNVKVFGP
jgi:hypothetical protein